MYDDRPLVDLINSRLDDVISRMEGLKSDILRETQHLNQKHKEHEEKDTIRFGEIDKLKWKITGGISVVIVLIQFAKDILFK